MSKADLSTILFRIGKPFETFAILNFNSLILNVMIEVFIIFNNYFWKFN